MYIPDKYKHGHIFNLRNFELDGHSMTDIELLERIVLNPKIMVGKPIIRGTRLTVDYILNRLAHGATEMDLLEEYPGILIEDIRACYLFATKALDNTVFMPLAINVAP